MDCPSIGVLCNSQGGRGRACGGSIRGGGGGGGEGGYIFTIQKQHSVDKVHTLQYSVFGAVSIYEQDHGQILS